MSLYQVVRIVLGVALSGVIGWISLLAFNAVEKSGSNSKLLKPQGRAGPISAWRPPP